jgi:hypothetical protein
VEVQPFPFQQLDEVSFPILEVCKPFNIVFEVIRQRTDNQEIQRNTENMTSNLDIDIVLEKPVAIKEDARHQDTVGFKQGECVPENICVRTLNLVFQNGPNGIVYGVPNTQEQVRPLPDLWYVVKNFQALKIVLKLIIGKEKPLNRGHRRQILKCVR